MSRNNKLSAEVNRCVVATKCALRSPALPADQPLTACSFYRALFVKNLSFNTSTYAAFPGPSIIAIY